MWPSSPTRPNRRRRLSKAASSSSCSWCDRSRFSRLILLRGPPDHRLFDQSRQHAGQPLRRGRRKDDRVKLRLCSRNLEHRGCCADVAARIAGYGRATARFDRQSIRAAARLAAWPSSMARNSKASAISSNDQSATKLRWDSLRRTNSSASSRRRASRTGVRETWQRCARASSLICAPERKLARKDHRPDYRIGMIGGARH